MLGLVRERLHQHEFGGWSTQELVHFSRLQPSLLSYLIKEGNFYLCYSVH
jgi:hypothetical protein